jgi:hypothetical protein
MSIPSAFTGPSLDRGRCLGHGAVPVSVADEIYNQLPDLAEAPSLIDGTRLGTRGGVYTHGYALLTFEADWCRTQYYQTVERGRHLLYEETFS